MRSPVSRVAAAVIFVLAITGVALWFHGGGATYAFADFIEPILEAKTAKFKMTTEMKGEPASTTGRSWCLTPLGSAGVRDGDAGQVQVENGNDL